MGTYRITTDGGTYDVTTDDGGSSSPTKDKASSDMSSISPFEQQMTKAMYNSVPFGKDIVNGLMGKQYGQAINNIPQAQGIVQGAGQLVGQGLSSLPAMAGGAAMIPGKILGGALGLGAQQAGQASSQGASPMQALGQGAMTAGGTYLGGKAFGLAGDALGGFKTYNDKLINDTAQSAVSKIQGAVQPLRDLYGTLTKPFSNQSVDSETFEKALSVVPKAAKQDFIDDYSSKILDANGKPTTTLGNLQKMELELKDKINQPKYGQTIGAQGYNIADAAKQLKQLRISQYPQETQDAIKTLDSKFGPVVNMSNELLPKMVSPNGKMNTGFLFRTFNNPADAGTRQYLANLKTLGVDLSPEINNLKGWVSRQAFKKGAEKVGGKIVEGATIGGALRGLP